MPKPLQRKVNPEWLEQRAARKDPSHPLNNTPREYWPPARRYLIVKQVSPFGWGLATQLIAEAADAMRRAARTIQAADADQALVAELDQRAAGLEDSIQEHVARVAKAAEKRKARAAERPGAKRGHRYVYLITGPDGVRYVESDMKEAAKAIKLAPYTMNRDLIWRAGHVCERSVYDKATGALAVVRVQRYLATEVAGMTPAEVLKSGTKPA